MHKIQEVLSRRRIGDANALHGVRNCVRLISMNRWSVCMRNWIWLSVCVGWMFTQERTDALPAQVILLRHGEKPSDPAEVHLSHRGERRAQALVTLLGKDCRWTKSAPIVALYATHLTKHDRSHRTSETLTPLSQHLGLPIESPYKSEEFEALARKLLSDSKYDGKTVVVCWTHHDLSQLAGALRVRPQPPAWKDSVFDRLWIIHYTSGKARLEDVPQKLLKGDSEE